MKCSIRITDEMVDEVIGEMIDEMDDEVTGEMIDDNHVDDAVVQII